MWGEVDRPWITSVFEGSSNMATNVSTAPNEIVFSPSQLPVEVTGMQAMASKMWIPFIAMGFMLVLAAFVVGIVNSGVASDYFTVSKAVREAAVGGSDLATDKAFIESTKIWLPAVKFLGLGLILGGVTFLLATILGSLRVGGGRVQQALGVEVKIPKTPMTAKLFPMFMMMGIMVLLAASHHQHPDRRPGLRLLEPLDRDGAEPIHRHPARRSGYLQRDQTLGRAVQVRRNGPPADRDRTGVRHHRQGTALAVRPAVGGPVLTS